MSARTALMITDDERAELRRFARHASTRQALATRCKVVLSDVQGLTYAAIGAKLDMREQTVLKWRGPFLKHRPPAFLKTIDKVIAETEPEDRSVHLVLDNYAAHKTPAVHTG